MKQQIYFLAASQLPIQNSKFKSNILFLSFLIFNLSLIIGVPCTHAQTLFREDFETTPVTSILNPSETQLFTGPASCGMATRGNTAILNSSNVNFNNAQNSTYFLGTNPEQCGGLYIAMLFSNTFNFSGKDSLRFRCRYFKGNTLGMGPIFLLFSFSDGNTNFLITNSQFSSIGNWANLDIALPAFLIAPGITFTISQMGGGEGIGLDDIEIVNFPPTPLAVEAHTINDNIKIYPNPFINDLTIQIVSSQWSVNSEQTITDNEQLSIINVLGEEVYTAPISAKHIVKTEHWNAGVYFYQIRNGQEIITTRKIIKN